MPLLYVLRNDLKLNGAEFGCSLGQCGSCTVMLEWMIVIMQRPFKDTQTAENSHG